MHPEHRTQEPGTDPNRSDRSGEALRVGRAPLPLPAALLGALHRYEHTLNELQDTEPADSDDHDHRLLQARRGIYDCLRHLGWTPPQDDLPAPESPPEAAQLPDPDHATRPDQDDTADMPPPERTLRASRSLAQLLATAERDSETLLQHLSAAQADHQSEGKAMRAAQHCRLLIQDAYLDGAVELAATLGVPDTELPP